MPLFRPSMVVNFRLRFDEAFQIYEAQEPLSEAELADKSPAVQGLLKTLQQQPIVRPLIMDVGDDNLSQIMSRIPKQGSVELPGYRQAGKFNLTFDFQDLPIDPRLLRACFVEIHLGSVSDADFSDGMVHADAKGGRRSVLRTTDDGGNPRPETMLLAGTVDSWAVEHGDKSSEVKIEGRDLRGILLDTTIDPRALTNLDLRRPINEVVQEILDKLATKGQRIIVTFNPDDWPQQITPGSKLFGSFGVGSILPAPATADSLTRVRLGANGKRTRSQPAGDAGKLKVWDIITQYCFLVGAIPFFQGTKLFIRPGRSLYDLQKKSTADLDFVNPFERNAAVGVRPAKQNFNIRKFVYGRDVQQMNFERKYGGVKVPVIKCVSVDTSSKERGLKKLLEVEFPSEEALKKALKEAGLDAKKVKFDQGRVPGGSPKIQQLAAQVAAIKKARTTSVTPGGTAHTETLTISVPGIKSRDRLLEIAKDIYEEIGRGEMGGSVSTRSLSSYITDGNGNDDPDVLKLRPGDAVQLLTDIRALSSNVPLVSELTEQSRRSFEEQVAFLQKKLGAVDKNVARVIVATARNSIIELQSFFRVANVKFDWNAGSLGCSFDYQNYVEARHKVVPSTGENVQKNVQKATKTIQKTPQQPSSPMNLAKPTSPAAQSIETLTKLAANVPRSRGVGSGGRLF